MKFQTAILITVLMIFSLGQGFAEEVKGPFYQETVSSHELEKILVADPQARPNILWIMSEDMGPELGMYGEPEARTPNLDALPVAHN